MTFEHIVSTPGILGGKPCIKGTRISVELVLEFVANGAAIPQIVENYPQLSEEAVRQAVLYAAYSLRNDVWFDIKVAA
jgi:uncharacterized protein (DUF433 family)